ncbi:MAG TPA: serine/threonine-protein kinase [Casimicrobiaceae bacterium]|nr:serine/threonine-protein kinase [Casimicrobiaceae bacterium]
MDRDRWLVVSPLLDHALALSAEERTAWLLSRPHRDPTIVAELQTLLAEADVLDRAGYLEQSAGHLVDGHGSLEGQTFGPYTIERLLGHGGMGSVWLARRSDGRYDGRVAIKLLNAAWVGRAAERRFRREGDVLARLSHRNITRLIDAGIAPTGQPYLVLEWVEGERIDAYCDAQRTDVEGRLRMFLDILEAVAHAHAHLIVHRDIKPSNVLVDRNGFVKLLDFGIAKLLEDDDGAQTTQLTREAGRVLTPEFAAPEQLTGQPVTTATDVYALGVLLHVLLVGQHPFGASTRTPATLIRAIVDAAPTTPSDAAASLRRMPREALTTNAELRGSTPDHLRRRLRGDLDNIVAKALDKNPQKRYASVSAFGDDVRRHLADQPIIARADSIGYRAIKFVRRNRMPVLLASLAAIATLAGLVGTTVQAMRAAEQRDFALRQVSRVEAVNDLTAFLLYNAGPSGKFFTANDLLGRGERIVERSAPATVNTDLLLAIGKGYQSLDEQGNERRVLGHAFELSRNDPDPAARARAACAWGRALATHGDRAESERVFADAFAGLPDKPQYVYDRIGCLLASSLASRVLGDAATGVARAEAAQRLIGRLDIPSEVLAFDGADSLAEAYREAGDFAKADAMFEVAFAKLQALGRESTQQAGTLYNNWGIALYQQGQPLRAEPLLRHAIEISESDAARSGVSPMLLANYANVLNALARYEEARSYIENAASQARGAGDEVALNVALMMQFGIDLDRNDLARAQRALDEVEPRLRRMLAPGHYAFASLASDRSLLAQARHQYPAALVAADQAIEIARANPTGAYAVPVLLVRRGALELEMDRAIDAERDAMQALALERPEDASPNRSTFYGAAYLALGRALAAQGKADAARAAFRSAALQYSASVGPEHPKTLAASNLATQVSSAPERGH